MKLPIPLHKNSTSRMIIPSEDSEKIRVSHLIIIDEASMLSNNAPHVIDRMHKEIMRSEKPFGGKMLLLGGDYRQTTPVICRGSKAAVIEGSLKHSYLWKFVRKFSLSENMHIAGQHDFNVWLLSIGNGSLTNDAGLSEDLIEIPQDLRSSGNILADVDGDSINYLNEEDLDDISSKTILTPKNSDTLKLNNELLNLLDGNATVYKSVDSLD